MASPLPPSTMTNLEDLGLIASAMGSPTGGNIPAISGAYLPFLTQTPEYQTFTAPLSNKGNPTSQYGNNSLAVAPDTPIRLVDSKGNVIAEGVGYAGAQDIISTAQNLSDTQGNKASWKIQVVPPEASGFQTVATEKKNDNILGKIADVALPIAGSFIPGVGPVLGAALGSAASSVAQGRSLENTLLRAGLAAGGSALGGQVFGRVAPGSDAAINASVNSAVQNAVNAGAQAGANALGSVYGSALGGAAGGAAGSVAGSATGGLIDDIIVTALQKSAPNFASTALGTAATSLIPSAFDSAQFNNIAPEQTTTVDQEYTPPPENLIVTARQPDVTGLFPAVTGGISNTLLDQVVNQPPAAPPAEPTVTDDEIVVTARPTTPVVPPFVPPIVVPPGILPPATTPTTPTTPPDTTPPADKKDVLGTGLTLSQLLAVGAIGSELLGGLFGGGGGGTGTAGPYVSPFGAGVGFGAGQDMRVNPNIADYEKYGFGPEAAFFRPEYSQILAAPAAQAQPAATTNPVYTPLI